MGGTGSKAAVRVVASDTSVALRDTGEGSSAQPLAAQPKARILIATPLPGLRDRAYEWQEDARVVHVTIPLPGGALAPDAVVSIASEQVRVCSDALSIIVDLAHAVDDEKASSFVISGALHLTLPKVEPRVWGQIESTPVCRADIATASIRRRSRSSSGRESGSESGSSSSARSSATLLEDNVNMNAPESTIPKPRLSRCVAGAGESPAAMERRRSSLRERRTGAPVRVLTNEEKLQRFAVEARAAAAERAAVAIFGELERAQQQWRAADGRNQRATPAPAQVWGFAGGALPSPRNETGGPRWASLRQKLRDRARQSSARVDVAPAWLEAAPHRNQLGSERCNDALLRSATGED